MHVSLQTLQSLVDLPFSSPQEVANKLTLAGLEIESIKTFENDTILELKITPNRPDALSHMGIARELAAVYQTRTTFLSPSVKELGASAHDLIQVNLSSKEACPRYAVRVIEGVQIAESPEWLQKKLLSLNLKPINNVVDISNWVLLERGQPLHAFDLDKLAKPKGRVALKIREAKAGEKIITLDGKERILTEQDLVIADEEKVLALAGVMGGKNSEVTSRTQNILLESAYFESTRIRKTAKRFQMSTDSSYRFERGTDPNGVLAALDRAAALIQEIAGGRIRRDVIDIYLKPIEPKEISLRPARLAALSALPESELDPAKLRARFLSLGIETSGRSADDALKFRIPTFRPDITDEIDLIEEAMRLIGFEHVPAQLSFYQSADVVSLNQTIDRLEKHVRSFLSQAGFYEAINYAFAPPKENALRLQNPLGEEFSCLRQNLLPGLLTNIRYNLRQQIQKPALFEIGVVFLGANHQGEQPNSSSLTLSNMSADAYAHEKLMLSGVMQGTDFFTLKGILESLFESLKIQVEFKPASQEFFHPAQSAAILLSGQNIGTVGYLHPDLSEHAKDCAFELSLEELLKHCFKMVQAKPLPKFPGIDRDLALVLDEKILGGDVLNAIRQFKPLAKILESARIFDVYQGKGIESGKKSLAISLSLRDLNKTLTEEEVQPLIDQLVLALVKTFQASLRTSD